MLPPDLWMFDFYNSVNAESYSSLLPLLKSLAMFLFICVLDSLYDFIERKWDSVLKSPLQGRSAAGIHLSCVLPSLK